MHTVWVAIQILDVDMQQKMLCKQMIAIARLQNIAVCICMHACTQVALWTASPIKTERCTRNFFELQIIVHQQPATVFFNG